MDENGMEEMFVGVDAVLTTVRLRGEMEDVVGTFDCCVDVEVAAVDGGEKEDGGIRSDVEPKEKFCCLACCTSFDLSC